MKILGVTVLLGFPWLAVDGSKAKGEWMPRSHRAQSSKARLNGEFYGVVSKIAMP
jgi:hypothetical protein